MPLTIPMNIQTICDVIQGQNSTISFDSAMYNLQQLVLYQKDEVQAQINVIQLSLVKMLKQNGFNSLQQIQWLLTQQTIITIFIELQQLLQYTHIPILLLFTEYDQNIDEYLSMNNIQSMEVSLLCLLCCKKFNEGIFKHIQVQKQINNNMTQQEQLLVELTLLKFIDTYQIDRLGQLINNMKQKTVWEIFKIVNYLIGFELEYLDKMINITRHYAKLNLFYIIGYISITDQQTDDQTIHNQQDINEKQKQHNNDIIQAISHSSVQQFIKYWEKQPIVIQHFSNGTNIQTFLNLYKYIKRYHIQEDIHQQILDIIIDKLNQIQEKIDPVILNEIVELEDDDIKSIYQKLGDIQQKQFLMNNQIFNILDYNGQIDAKQNINDTDTLLSYEYYTINGFILITRQNSQNIIKQMFTKPQNNTFTLILNLCNIQTSDGEILLLGYSSNQIDITLTKSGNSLSITQSKRQKNIELSSQSTQICIYQNNSQIELYINQVYQHTFNTKSNKHINYIHFQNIVVEYVHITEQLLPIQSLVTFQKFQQYRLPIFGVKACNILSKKHYKKGYIINDKEQKSININELVTVEQYNSQDEQLQHIDGNIKVLYQNKYTTMLSQQMLFNEKYADEIVEMLNYHGKCSIQQSKLITFDLVQTNYKNSMQIGKICYNIEYTSTKGQMIQELFDINHQKQIIFNAIAQKHDFNVGTLCQLTNTELRLQYVTYYYQDIKDNKDLQTVLYEVDKVLFINLINPQFVLNRYYNTLLKRQDIHIIYHIRNSLVNTDLLSSDVISNPHQTFDKSVLLYLFLSGYLYSINLKLLDFIVQKLTVAQLEDGDRQFLIRILQKTFYILCRINQVDLYPEDQFQNELANTIAMIQEKQHSMPHIQQYQQTQQLQCLQILYKALFNGFFDDKEEIKYYIIIFSFITSTFNNEQLDIILDKKQFRNLKYFLFNLIKQNVSEGIRLILEKPNIILVMLALEYLVFISDKMMFADVDFQSIYTYITQYECNYTVKKGKDVLQTLIKNKYFNLQLQENYKVGQLHSTIMISFLYIGLKQYQQNEDTSLVVSLYIMALQTCLNNQIYQNEMLIFYDQHTDVYTCYKLLCVTLNLWLLESKEPLYSQHYNKQLSESQILEIQKSQVVNISINKNIKEFLINLSVNMLQNIQYQSIESLQIAFLYKVQHKNQEKVRDKLFNIYILQLKQQLLNGTNSIQQYDMTKDLYIQLFEVQNNIDVAFFNTYNCLSQSQNDYGLFKSSDKVDHVIILVCFAAKLPIQEQIPIYIKKVITKYTNECVNICVDNDYIEDQERLYNVLHSCLDNSPQPLVELIQTESTLSSKLNYKKQQIINKFMQEGQYVNQQTIYLTTLLSQMYTLEQECIQIFYFHKNEQQKISQYDIQKFIRQQHIQYHISILISLLNSMVDYKMQQVETCDFKKSRLQLRESQLRSRNHYQLMFNDMQLTQTVDYIQQRIEPLISEDSLYVSTFVPFNDKLLFAVNVCYYLLSNISGECGVLIGTLQHIIFVPCVRIKPKQDKTLQSEDISYKLKTNFTRHSQFKNEMLYQNVPEQAYYSNFVISDDVQLDILYHKKQISQSTESDIQFNKIIKQILSRMIIINKDKIKNVQNRYFAHRQSAFEVFTNTGYTFQFHIMDKYVEFIMYERYLIKEENTHKQKNKDTFLNSEIIRGIMLEIFKSFNGIQTEGLHFRQNIINFINDKKKQHLQLYSYFGHVIYSPELCANDQKLFGILAKNLGQSAQKYNELIRDYYISYFDKYITSKNQIIVNLSSYNNKIESYFTKEATQMIQKQFNQSIDNKQYLCNIFYQLYVNDIITTKEFILYINQISCRSPNDLTMYPILPVIKNRALSLPVQAQTNERQQLMVDRQLQINDMLKLPDRKNFEYIASVLLNCDMYMNGTFASNPASVIYFCCRQQPYTSALIDLQAGKFDSPDRMFHSYYCLYDNIFDTNHNEHILPLFQSLYIYYNTFNFDLGKRNDGQQVDDLDCNYKNNTIIKNPLQVIFELNYNIEHVNKQEISKWLKLFFGDKQSSIESYNAYQSQLYCYKQHINGNNKQEIDKIRYFGSIVWPIYQVKEQTDKGKNSTNQQNIDNENNSNQFIQALTDQITDNEKQNQEHVYNIPLALSQNSNNIEFTNYVVYKYAMYQQIEEFVSNKIVLNKKQLEQYIESNKIFQDTQIINLTDEIIVDYDQTMVKFYFVTSDVKLQLAIIKLQELIHNIFKVSNKQLICQTISQIIVINIKYFDENCNTIQVSTELMYSSGKIYASCISLESGILYMITQQRQKVADDKKSEHCNCLVALDIYNGFVLNQINLGTYNLQLPQQIDIQVNEEDYIFVRQKQKILIFNPELICILNNVCTKQGKIIPGKSIFNNTSFCQIEGQYLHFYKLIFQNEVENLEIEQDKQIQILKNPDTFDNKQENQQIIEQEMIIYGHSFERANSYELTDNTIQMRQVGLQQPNLQRTDTFKFQNQIAQLSMAGRRFCVKLISGQTYTIDVKE